MTAIVERKALDIDYRKHGINIVWSPPRGLIRGSDKDSAQLNIAHCQICIPAMRTSNWKVREPILEVLMDKKRIRAPEWSGGSPGPGFNQISKQGLMVWYTTMVYKEGKADMTTARERYEAKTKVVTFRVSQELYEELEEIRGKAGLSFTDLIKLGAGITREEIQKKLSEVSELQAQLAELRKTIRQEQKTLDAFIDTTKKEQLAKLEQQYQIYTLFDAGFNTDEVRFKMGISKSDVSRHFKEWGELRGEKEKLQTELLKKCLWNYIASLRDYICYRATGRDLEEAKQRLEHSQLMLTDPLKLTEEEKALLIADYSYFP